MRARPAFAIRKLRLRPAPMPPRSCRAVSCPLRPLRATPATVTTAPLPFRPAALSTIAQPPALCLRCAPAAPRCAAGRRGSCGWMGCTLTPAREPSPPAPRNAASLFCARNPPPPTPPFPLHQAPCRRATCFNVFGLNLPSSLRFVSPSSHSPPDSPPPRSPARMHSRRPPHPLHLILAAHFTLFTSLSPPTSLSSPHSRRPLHLLHRLHLPGMFRFAAGFIGAGASRDCRGWRLQVIGAITVDGSL